MTDHPLAGEPPCARCAALCCRGFTMLTLRPDEHPEDRAVVAAGYAERHGAFWVLPRVDGRCAYLDDATNRCLIHDDRPRACRDWDCRRPWAARTLIALLTDQGVDATGSPPWDAAQAAGPPPRTRPAR